MLFRVLGFVFLGIGAAGIFLPLLPTTPWILVSAACFARSSPRMHAWLLGNPTFGPLVRNWDENRCVTLRLKIFAIVSMVLVGGVSIFFALESWTWRLVGGLLILVGALMVSGLRTCEKKAG